MEIDQELIDFIDNNKNLIDKNGFKELYQIYDKTYITYPTKLTLLLLAADINPLIYMNAIPANYLHWADKIPNIIIPNNIESIGNSAFFGCESLTHINIPNNTTFIGSYVFAKCKSLTSIIIPDKVEFIGEGAFKDCKALTNIVIGRGIKGIDNAILDNSNKNIQITYNNVVDKLNGLSIHRNNSEIFKSLIYCTNGIAHYNFKDNIWEKID